MTRSSAAAAAAGIGDGSADVGVVTKVAKEKGRLAHLVVRRAVGGDAQLEAEVGDLLDDCRVLRGYGADEHGLVEDGAVFGTLDPGEERVVLLCHHLLCDRVPENKVGLEGRRKLVCILW